MRLIGHLPNEASAARFSDFLCLQGISNLVESEKDGWAVWIHSEDEIQKAKDFLFAYLGNPQEPRFQKASRQARQLLERQGVEVGDEPQEQAARAPLIFGIPPVTLLLTLASITIFIIPKLALEDEWIRKLFISDYPRTLPEVARGEIWRLFTPILLHGGVMHLAINLLWLLDLGGLIERRQGSRRFGLLVLGLAAVSNLTQYYLSGPEFCGLSGVVFGLLGYIWIRGRVDPASGLFLNRQVIIVMLVWFFLCFTPLPFVLAGVKIANGAHAAGLVAGMIVGYLSGLRKLARE